MSFERKFFGTNGIRGVPGVDLTLEFIVEMSQAIGTYFGKGPILVGYDGRLSSPLISKAVSAGVMASGLDVAEAGLTPTPGLQYSVRKLGYNGGVMITASHNPPQYNGIKVVGSDGVEIPREHEAEIEKIYLNRAYKRADWRGIGSYRSESAVIQTYIEGALSQVDGDIIKKRTLKVVLDLGNSVATLAVPYALSSLSCKVL
ncbi:MAG: phosphoglucosamine mutase, partial [archaeon]|nr:phosphoglucosamine mutase [archaeon]